MFSRVKEYPPTHATHKNVITNLKAWISSCSAALDLRIASSVGRQIEPRLQNQHIDIVKL